MFRYIQSAFWERVAFQGFGNLPVNALAVSAFAILGFGHPSFWLLGLGLEGAYLGLLATHPRYRQLVDSRALPTQNGSVAAEQAALETRLGDESRVRLMGLRDKIRRTNVLLQEHAEEAFLIEHNTQALQRLEWLALKLLLARDNLKNADAAAGLEELSVQIQALQTELAASNLSASLRESKSATLDVLHRRREVFEQRSEAIRQMDSDLQRVEAQIDLALDSASIQGPTAQLSGSVDLASQLFEHNFGDSGAAVSRLDHLILDKES